MNGTGRLIGYEETGSEIVATYECLNCDEEFDVIICDCLAPVLPEETHFDCEGGS